MIRLLPPMAVRRAAVDPPAFVLAVLGAVLLLPVAVLASVSLPALPSRCRPAARLVVVAFAWLATYEAGGLLGAFCLWLARSRRDAYVRLHDRVLLLWTRVAFPMCRLRGEWSGEGELPARDRPVLVLAQHTGSFAGAFVTYLTGAALGLDSAPIVKEALAFDPAMDVLLRRLGSPFIRTDPAGRIVALRTIARVAGGLGRVTLFPEGTAFTKARAAGAVAALRRSGEEWCAEQAATLRRTLPPHLGGVRMALRAAPEADVVFLAHTGITPVLPPSAGAWRVPYGGRLRARYWVVPAAEVPREADKQAAWLYDWWARMDAWTVGASGIRDSNAACGSLTPKPLRPPPACSRSTSSSCAPTT